MKKAATTMKTSNDTDDDDVHASDGTTTMQKGWNDMSHLSIKRFHDNDPTLTAGAKRNRLQYPYIAIAEYDPSGRATCKLCGTMIQPKGIIRINHMMECHKGYRNVCTLHEICFWKHDETSKLISVDKIYIHPTIINDDPSFKTKLMEQFNTMKNNTIA
jgi:hypothetical protein